jgi:hypothetical protein
LEPAVEDLMIDFKEKDSEKYAQEHEECDAYYDSVVSSDQEKF